MIHRASVLSLSLLFALTARADVLEVTTNADNGPGSLRRAIRDAAAGDSIRFAPDVTGTIALSNGDLMIERNLSIEGPGARRLTIGSNDSSVGNIFQVLSGTVSISGLKMNGVFTGVTVAGGELRLGECTITGNQAGGVAAASGATLVMDRCTIARNDALRGAGLYNGGTATLTNCTVADNESQYGNFSQVGGDGGGIFNVGTLTLVNCTIAGNSAIGGASSGDGGGGVFNAGTIHLSNTIVASNSTDRSGPDVSGSFSSDGYNLVHISDGSTGFSDGTAHDRVGTSDSPKSANLAQLQNNGGPTDTRAPGSASRAIDAGRDAVAPARDQRGYLRRGVSDIGAVEFGGTIPVTLANLATRGRVETGDNVMIGGFIVTGEQPKKVIVRAIGSSLGTIPDHLADPTLELFEGAGQSIALNDNWRSAPNQQEIVDSTLAPANDLESAILASLTPGAYTAVVRGANDTSGIALVEVYDLDRTVDSRLGNIATRGLVQTGDNVLIGGFIIVGADAQEVIVRAVGPSVAVPGQLLDPTLELHDGNGALMASNDNWRSNQEAEIIATGVAPTDDVESAIVRTLTPGAYTAIVRGANGATGIALVEAYGLK